MKALVTTVPFGQSNRLPIELLNQSGLEYTVNPLGRKLTEDDLVSMVGDVDILIAGTEPLTQRVFEAAPHLRLISRVGIGLDSVDLLAARSRGIQVAYTPDAPAPAVAELTLGLMLALLRGIHIANDSMHKGQWTRIMGRRLSEVTLGVIGVGRIGQRVLRRVAAFGTPRILANDIDTEIQARQVPDLKLEWTDKDTIFRQADLITLHVPLTPMTYNLVGARELTIMKDEALLINTARGGIVDESALAKALQDEEIAGAGIDTFLHEPYRGPLASLDNCLLTSHMGSMSEDCRSRMEIEATEDAIRFSRGVPLNRPVPEREYEVQSLGLDR